MYAGGAGVLPRRPRRRRSRSWCSPTTGVDAYLDIDNGWDDKIPADALAVVGNRSAVGEQYVDLQPQTDDGPYLHDGSQIATADTRTPLADPEAARRHLDHRRVGEPAGRCAPPSTSSGTAFAGTGQDLQRIIDTGTSFIHDGQPQLRRHHGADPRQQHRAARPGRLRRRDPLLRPRPAAVLRHAGRPRPRPARASSTTARSPPPSCARSSRTTRSTWPSLINNLVTTGDIVVKHLPGLAPDPGALPLRRRGRLHRRLEVAGDRAVRRPLRHGPHQRPEGLPQRLPEHRHPAAAGRLQPADERERALRRAGLAVRRRAAPSTPRPTGPARRTAPRSASYDPTDRAA